MHLHVRWRVALIAAALAARAAALRAQDVAPSTAADSAVVRALAPFIVHEMRDKALPALSIALVDGPRVVWATGFGVVDSAGGTPATAATVYRAGGVSELFTDIAIMRLVQRGVLDLDAPVARWLPGFAPRNPFGGTITLRELMTHRAGLVREPPVGSRFDSTAPSLAATVASLDSTTLVYAPGTHTKYSEAGIAVAGLVVERATHEPFAAWVRRDVLEPLGMTGSAFGGDGVVARAEARGETWTLDGRRFPAPGFEPGIAPAAGMYTSALDLARFLRALFTIGRAYGPGFTRSTLDGRPEIARGGSILGFTARLAALPRERLGAVVLTRVDGVGAVASRVADAALRLMAAARAGRPLVAPDTTTPVPPALARRLAGRWGAGASAVDLVESNGVLRLDPVRGGASAALRMRGDTLIADGRLAYGTRLVVRGDELIVHGAALRRVALGRPAPAPARWRGLIGEYGWDRDVLYILERDGRLQALIEWFHRYPLAERSRDVYRFPRSGRYDGETVTFRRDEAGRATGVRVGGVWFPRRATGPEDGSQFRITPVRPVAELRAEALAARPPAEPATSRVSDLVELTTLDSTIHLDIRYATSNNFMGTPMYTEARAFLQRPAAEALVRVSRWLRARGYGLLVHDAYRPWYVTKMFWDATPDDEKVFVADPAHGSRHNRGCAVDLTLYDLRTGTPVSMTGGYDEMTDRSYADYPGGTSLQRWHRALLRRAMEMQGFTVYDAEWWHFDYEDWRSYPIGNEPFERIGAPRRRPAVIPPGSPRPPDPPTPSPSRRD